MPGEHVDDGGRVVQRRPVDAQLLEGGLTRAPEGGGRVDEDAHEAFEVGPGRRGLQVLDDLVADTRLVEQRLGAARLAAAGVVEQGRLGHGAGSYRWARRWRAGAGGPQTNAEATPPHQQNRAGGGAWG